MQIAKWLSIGLGFLVSVCCTAFAVLIAMNGAGLSAVIVSAWFGLAALCTGGTAYNRIFHPEIFTRP